MGYGTIVARSLVGVVALMALVPKAASAQATPAPVVAPSPLPTPVGAPATPLPYPAYGTPAPGVSTQQPVPNVPASISLQQAVDVAAAQSPLFEQERAIYRATAAAYGAAKGALYPNVSGTAGIERSFGGGQNNGSTAGNASLGLATVTTENGRISLTQLIYDGGRVIAGLRAAEQRDVAGRETLQRQLQTLVFDVANAYYGVLQAQASIDADASLVRQFQAQEAVVSAQIRAGAAARSDLAAVEFQTAQARAAVITAQGALIAAQSTFNTTLGLNADAAVTPQNTGLPPQQRTLSYQQAVTQALQLRPDYLAAINTVTAAQDNLRYAKLARFPSVTANASDGSNRTLISAPPVDSGFVNSRSLGATINIPIYDQGITNYNVAVAASELDQAIAGVRLAELGVQNDVRSALSNLVSAEATLVQTQAELRSATVNLQATQARYRVGAATITDIITAQAGLATASRDQVAALYNEQTAEQRYNYALGTNDLRIPNP